jgi:hypothetical protein
VTKKEMPTCELSHLKLKGKVIGVDSKGVMLTLFGEETMGMYIPFGVLGELPMTGSTVMERDQPPHSRRGWAAVRVVSEAQ